MTCTTMRPLATAFLVALLNLPAISWGLATRSLGDVPDVKHRSGQLTPALLEAPLPLVVGDPAKLALELLGAQRTQWHIRDVQEELAVTGVVRLPLGDWVVRGERRLEGHPVLGRSFRLLITPGNPRGLFLGNLDPVAPLATQVILLRTPAEAIRVVEKLLPQVQPRGVAQARLLVVPRPEASRLAWRIALPAWAAMGPADLMVLIDAETGGLLGLSPLTRSVRQGQVYETNPVTSELVTVDLPDLDEGVDSLTGQWAVVRSARLSQSRMVPRQQAVSDEEGNFLFAPNRRSSDSDPFAEVMAYYQVNKVHAFFSQLGLSQDVLQRVPIYVNIDNLENAYYNGADGSIVFGDPGVDFVYDGDVIYHEYTHAVVDQTAGLSSGFDMLGFNDFPSALNEGFADAFSTTLSDDPALGEYVGSWGSDSIRHMEGDATCPRDMVGESHEDGSIWAQTAWEIRSILGRSEYEAFLWGVLNQLSPESDFITLHDTVVRYARRHYDQDVVAQIREVLDRRQLLKCNRVVPLSRGESHRGLSFSSMELFQGAVTMDLPIPLHYQVTVPCGTNRLSVQLDPENMGWGAPEFTLLAREGRPVEYEYSERGMSVSPVADQEVSAEAIDISAPPAGTWFFTLMNTGRTSFFYTLGVNYVARAGGAQECTCEDGRSGASICGEDGAWGTCVCAEVEGAAEGEGEVEGGEGEGEGVAEPEGAAEPEGMAAEGEGEGQAEEEGRSAELEGESGDPEGGARGAHSGCVVSQPGSSSSDLIFVLLLAGLVALRLRSHT